jgi:hypothetical protein
MIFSPPMVALAIQQLLQHTGSPHVLRPREIPTVRSNFYFTWVSVSGNGERRQRYESWQFLGVKESPSWTPSNFHDLTRSNNARTFWAPHNLTISTKMWNNLIATSNKRRFPLRFGG